MKKHSSLRLSLGVKQHEIAMLLNVSRSQWSMFESGKRNLPLHATQKLAELLSQAKPDEKQNKKSTNDNLQYQKIIENMLLENEYQTAITNKKITALEKKIDTAQRRSILIETLTNTNKNQQRLLAPKTAKYSQHDFPLELLKLTLKLELLIHEKLLLESKLQKITESPEIINGDTKYCWIN